MAVKSSADICNNVTINPSEAEKAVNSNVLGRSFDGANINLLNQGHTSLIQFTPVSVPNSSTVTSVPFKVPFPMRVVRMDYSCHTIGSTASAELFTSVDAGSNYVTAQSAATALTAATVVSAEPVDTSQALTLDSGDYLRVSFTGTSGNLVGAVATLVMVRL